jgi:hypothetical protein
MMDSSGGSEQPTWWVACLCAAWCGVCREWQPTFTAQARANPHLRFAWVDVEDEDEAMGDVDIETFPTLLIARGGTPLFLGPMQPSAAQLSRLLAGLEGGDAPGTPVSPDAAPLLARLAACVLSKP